jgi:antitoxin HigA-1
VSAGSGDAGGCLDEGDIAQIRVTEATGIPAPHLTQMKHGKRRCTPEYDLRLGKFDGISAGFFLRLQMAYELEKKRREKADQIDSIKARLVEA